MILTVGGIKGGCGKSLISTNLCVMRAKLGKRVLLVDADEQGSASDWSDQRIASGVETPWTTIRLKAAAVRSEVMKLAKDYDDIIIDCGGRDTSSLRAALTVSDTFLVPFQPKSFDIWTSDKVSTLAQEAIALNDRLQAYAFINCGNTRGSDNEDAQKILSNIEGISLLPATITMRKAFSNATAEGLEDIPAPVNTEKTEGPKLIDTPESTPDSQEEHSELSDEAEAQEKLQQILEEIILNNISRHNQEIAEEAVEKTK